MNRKLEDNLNYIVFPINLIQFMLPDHHSRFEKFEKAFPYESQINPMVRGVAVRPLRCDCPLNEQVLALRSLLSLSLSAGVEDEHHS